MKISVALCTFDGAAFLGEQLESIAAQSRLPDELVVCDDGSTDGTLDLLHAFAARVPFRVRIEVNPERLGSTRNFERAISLCEGEVVFLADQDDVWYPSKIAVVAAAFELDPELACAFTDARMIDEPGSEVAPSLWDHIGFRKRERRRFERGEAFEILIVHNVVTGTTMAVRKRYLSAFLPIPSEHGMIHDRWMALISSAVAHIDPLETVQVDYRQHARQQIGSGDRVGGVKQWVDTARDTDEETYALWAAQLRLADEHLTALGRTSPARMELLRSRIRHLEVRATLPHQPLRRALAVLREVGTLRYHRHSNHLWSIAKDLFWKPGKG